MLVYNKQFIVQFSIIHSSYYTIGIFTVSFGPAQNRRTVILGCDTK